MRSLYIYDGRWPHNATRVGKQVGALRKAGHSVRILSRGDRGKARRERDGTLEVVRLPQLASQPLDRLVTYPVFANPFWLWHIWANARECQADCIIVRDLPLAPAALLAGRVLGVPVFYDMAEVYPLGLRSILPHEAGTGIRVVQALHVAERVEKLVVRSVAVTFVVSEESKARCERELHVPPDRAVLVGNTPANREALRARWPVPEDLAAIVGRPTAIFVGNVFADRGMRYAIDAMAIVTREMPNAALVVIGEGRELPLLKARSAELDLGENVLFLGWKHHDVHPAYLGHADVGLLPFLATEHIGITIANKLFDYMAAGLPVVASDVRPMRRVLAGAGSGLLVPPADAAALADALLALFRNPNLRKQLGKQGQSAVEERYRWEDDERRFVDAVEHHTSIQRKKAPGPERMAE